MSVPLIDLHCKYVIDFTLRTVISDPDKYIPEIFGDSKIEPQAALYGDRMMNEIKNWITTVKVPVVLGWDLDPTQIPGVAISLQQSAPYQQYMGDAGFLTQTPLAPFERDVMVPAFSPKQVIPSGDGTFTTIILPDTMPPEQSQLVLPGLVFRDKLGQEYGIGSDGTNPTAVVYSPGPLLDQADFSRLEVISPVTVATARQGSMTFDEMALITVHGHANRTEGLWLWAIVQWGLLKFRPLLTATFGMDLALPQASDFMKDDSYQGENVWRRFITLGAKSTWSWEGPRQQDVVAFLLSIKAGSQDPENKETVDLT